MRTDETWRHEPLEEMNRLEKIRGDHVSGATEIAIRCAEYLRDEAESIAIDRPETFFSRLTEVGTELKEAQPAMAPVHNAVHSVLTAVSRHLEKGGTSAQLRTTATQTAQNFINHIKCSLEDLSKEGFTIMQGKRSVMTYSSSRAVAALLKHVWMKGLRFAVVVPESRPMSEGRLLARDLGSVGVPCTIIVDGAVSAFLEEVDVVLVGADRVSEHWAINKIGTRGLAIMARAFRVPIYCACETSKFLCADRLPFTQKEMPTDEIWKTAYDNVTIRNLYFEKIPLDSFTGFITEKGIVGIEDVRRIVTEASA